MTLLRSSHSLSSLITFARQYTRRRLLIGGHSVPDELMEAPLEKMPDFLQTAGKLFELTETDKDVFKPSILWSPRQNHSKAAYGGLIFAQSLAAAERTVDDSLLPHSTHSYFILNVDTSLPIEYRVRRIRDGRSFCTRTVDAVQNDKIAFSMQASFHKAEPNSIIHQRQMPDVPPPENLIGLRKAIPFIKKKIESGELNPSESIRKRINTYDSIVYTSNADIFEMRPTSIEKYYGFDTQAQPKMDFWMRTRGDLPAEDEKLHRYLVSFNTDSVLAGTAVRPHSTREFQASMLFSLDHSVWFHRPHIKADEWLLYETESTIASGSRAFIYGRLWTRDGTLILSTAQEALIRTRGQESRI